MIDLSPSNDFLVKGLDKIVPAYADFDGDMFAGTLPMDNGNRKGKTMFWLFEPRKQKVEKSIVIWLNGGPVSSQNARYMALSIDVTLLRISHLGANDACNMPFPNFPPRVAPRSIVGFSWKILP